MKTIIFICCFVLSINNIFAQGGEINGKVTGSVIDAATDLPVEFSTISIYNAQDSSFATGGVTDIDGNFDIPVGNEGKYYLQIEYIGYTPKIVSNINIDGTNPVKNVGIVLLSQTSVNLSEIVVQEQRSQMQMMIDKRVFNADASLTTRGADALELLAEIPSVEVDPDGEVSLRGSTNVNILIDGRPTGIPANELLQTMPASQIDRIEIITNPSAKYEAEGMSGILNVITKKNSQRGIHGTVSTNFSQGIKARFDTNASLSYRTKKINAYTNIGYNRRNRNSSGSVDKYFTLPDSAFSLLTESEMNFSSNSFSVKAGVDYFINDRNTFMISATTNPGGGEGYNLANYRNLGQFGENLGTSTRHTDEKDKKDNYGVQAGWTHNFLQKDHQLMVDFFHNINGDLEEQFYREDFYDSYGVILPEPIMQVYDLQEDNDVTRVSLDYTKPISDKFKLEAGYRYDQLNLDNNVYSAFFDYETGDYVFDSNLSNDFDYAQSVNALYSTFTGQLNKFSFQAGLRYEYTDIDGKLINTGEEINRGHGNFFPTLSWMYNIAPGSDINISYSKRIKRPRSRQLNPFTDYSDPYNLRRGNPNLKPELTDALELNFMRIWDQLTLNATVFGNYTKDQIDGFLFPLEDGITIMNPENVGESMRYGLELFMNYTPFSWWRMNISGTARQNIFIQTNLELVNDKTTSMNFSYMSTFRLPNSMNIQLSSRYRPGFKTNQGKMYDSFNADLAVSKDFLNNKLSVTLQARDFLGTQRFKYELNQSVVHQQTYREWDSHRFGIALSYRFGQEIKDNKRGQDRPNEGFDDMEMM